MVCIECFCSWFGWYGHAAVHWRSPSKCGRFLGTAAARTSGVTDALLAELSANDLALVEREQLQRIADDQAVETLLGNLRLESPKLGKLLRAMG